MDIAPILATAGESLLIIQRARYGTFGFQRDEQIKGGSAGRRLLLIEPELPSLPAIAKWCLSLLGASHSGKFPIRDFRAMERPFPPYSPTLFASARPSRSHPPHSPRAQTPPHTESPVFACHTKIA